MRIFVSHFGRQYSNALLVALVKKGWLQVFFTALAANKLPWKRFPRRLQPALRKRVFERVPAGRMRHFPLLFILERLFRNRSGRIGDWATERFDRLVAQAVPRYAPDVVLTYENTNRMTMQSAKRQGKITVLDLAQIHHDDIVEYGRWFLSPERLVTEINRVNPRKAEALQYTDYVLALSSFAADSMIRNGWPPERLFIANLGIDPLRFAPKTAYATTGPLRLLFVGTIMRRKGLERLFDALSGLHQETYTLTLIGPMADAGDLLERHAGLYRYLPFLHHEDLVGHYQEADVFVFPSLLDSWAQTVLEAMACGTPAIVTEHTGARDAVRQGGGWIIPPNDALALREAILHCMSNRTDVEARGKKAREIALQYTWEHYEQQVASALETIARREQISLT